MNQLYSSTIFATFLTSTVLSVGLAACGGNDGAGPDDTETRLRSTLPEIVQATEKSLEVLDAMPAMDWISESLDALNLSFASLPIEIPSLIEDGTSALAFKKAADGEEDIVEQLLELVFNEESYEGDGYFRLRPEVVCEKDLAGNIDQQCVKEVNRAEIRLRAVLAGDGLDISLAIGPDRSEPLILELRSDRLSAVIDLAEGKDAIAHLAEISGEDADLPEVMEGVLAFSLVVNGDKDVSLETAVRQPVRVEAALAQGAISFSSEAKEPMASIRLQENQVTFRLDVGKTVLSVPWQLAGDGSLAQGDTFRMEFAGISVMTTLRPDDQSATIRNIGLGDGTTSIKLDDHALFALDLNADLGRRFDVTITPTANGAASFLVEPGFDLSMAFDLRPLALAGDQIEEFMLNETYRIAFTGNDATAAPYAPDTANDGGIRIESGTLTISSTAATDDIVVTAGQCLVENPTPPAEAHAVLGFLTTAACP